MDNVERKIRTCRRLQPISDTPAIDRIKRNQQKNSFFSNTNKNTVDEDIYMPRRLATMKTERK